MSGDDHAWSLPGRWPPSVEESGRIPDRFAIDAILIGLILEDIAGAPSLLVPLGPVEGASVSVSNPGSKPEQRGAMASGVALGPGKQRRANTKPLRSTLDIQMDEFGSGLQKGKRGLRREPDFREGQ